MHVTDPHIWRGGAYVFIALFSCLQILFGFFLITEDGPKPAVPVVKMALYNDTFDIADNTDDDIAIQLNKIMPAAGTELAPISSAPSSTSHVPTVAATATTATQEQDAAFHEIAKKLSTLNSTTPITPQYRPPLQAR